MIDWLLLAATLPGTPSALRVRVWRSLRATGCASLRDGVYLLPADAPTAPELRALEATIAEAGADSHLLSLHARDARQESTFVALFDRAASYAEFGQKLKATRAASRGAEPADLRQGLRALERQLDSIRATDFFPGKAREAAERGLATLAAEVHRRQSPGEPSSVEGVVARLSVEAFRGRVWATRKRPWVDRLATAWLVRRFIDSKARFAWIDAARKAPKGALGFDFDGARFTHVGDKVTFEVVAEAFGLRDDPGVERLGQLVHYLDAGGIPVDEAAGVEAMVRGLHARHDDDDALLAAALPLFDSLHAALGMPS
jgi:hypothetical protein